MIHLGRLLVGMLKALCGSDKGSLYEEDDFKKAAKAGEPVCDACVAAATNEKKKP